MLSSEQRSHTFYRTHDGTAPAFSGEVLGAAGPRDKHLGITPANKRFENRANLSVSTILKKLDEGNEEEAGKMCFSLFSDKNIRGEDKKKIETHIIVFSNKNKGKEKLANFVNGYVIRMDNATVKLDTGSQKIKKADAETILRVSDILLNALPSAENSSGDDPAVQSCTNARKKLLESTGTFIATWERKNPGQKLTVPEGLQKALEEQDKTKTSTEQNDPHTVKPDTTKDILHPQLKTVNMRTFDKTPDAVDEKELLEQEEKIKESGEEDEQGTKTDKNISVPNLLEYLSTDEPLNNANSLKVPLTLVIPKHIELSKEATGSGQEHPGMIIKTFIAGFSEIMDTLTQKASVHDPHHQQISGQEQRAESMHVLPTEIKEVLTLVLKELPDAQSMVNIVTQDGHPQLVINTGKITESLFQMDLKTLKEYMDIFASLSGTGSISKKRTSAEALLTDMVRQVLKNISKDLPGQKHSSDQQAILALFIVVIAQVIPHILLDRKKKEEKHKTSENKDVKTDAELPAEKRSPYTKLEPPKFNNLV